MLDVWLWYYRQYAVGVYHCREYRRARKSPSDISLKEINMKEDPSPVHHPGYTTSLYPA